MNLRDIFKRKPVRYGLAGFGASVVVYGIFLAGSPVYKEYQGSFAAKEFKEYGVLGAYQKRFFNFQFKLNEMKALDIENQELNRKVASLEKEIEIGRSGETEKEAESATITASKKLKSEAGSELARVTQSIEYQAPTNLLPNQLYTLAVGYFRKQEYEQAAVILSQLVDLKEDTSYQKAEVQMMCAIAWYKLKHFKLTHHYLSQVKTKSQPADTIYRTALVWEALTAKAEGNTQDAQTIVTSIISRYPHSEEAKWVNQRVGLKHETRTPASREKEYPVLQRKVDSTHEDKHDAHSEPDSHDSHAPAPAHSESHSNDHHEEVKHEH